MTAKERTLTGVAVGHCEECSGPLYVTRVTRYASIPDRVLVTLECDGECRRGIVTPVKIEEDQR